MPKCINCPEGKYQKDAGQSACTTCATCPAGKRSGCGNSTEGFCSDCIPGQYADSSSSSCVDCPAGKHSTAKNAEACDACQAGQFQSGDGQSFCVPCQAGSITNAGSATGARSYLARSSPQPAPVASVD